MSRQMTADGRRMPYTLRASDRPDAPLGPPRPVVDISMVDPGPVPTNPPHIVAKARAVLARHGALDLADMLGLTGSSPA